MPVDLDFVKRQARPDAGGRIVLLVLDGLGGLPRTDGGPTELEVARTPHLDALAARGVCGLHEPVGPGVTPGSGPAHLGLFGYDPTRFQVGRGVLAALGIDFDLRPGDVAARGNFCTVDGRGAITDRRAGRIGTDANRALCRELGDLRLDGVEVFVETVKEHRFVLVLRGPGVDARVGDTDPQRDGVPPVEARALAPEAAATASRIETFCRAARAALRDRRPANMVLLRGFASRPDWPRFGDCFGVRAAAIAGYPMYRGLARLLGMDVLDSGEGWTGLLGTLERHHDEHDFFYVHVKATDLAGEDGDFDRKVAAIEEVDAGIPRLLALRPDVVVVTGDHSTPATLGRHSWHPVPVLLWSRTCRPDAVTAFGERACVAGALGPRLPATSLMPLAAAHAGRLAKFGA